MLKRAFILGALALAGCQTPQTITPSVDSAALAAEEAFQRSLVIDARRDERVRLFRVSRNIYQANLDMCEQAGRVRQASGFLAETLSDYPEDWQDIAEDDLGLSPLPRIIALVPGGPAEQAGLQVDDIILSVSGLELDPAESAQKLAKQFRQGLEDAEDAGDVTLEVLRRSETLTVTLTPHPTCDYQVFISDSPRINAYANGRSIIFFRGMMKVMEDDQELALIFSHELAHNVLKHISFANGLSVIRYTPQYESEADYVGLYMMARAGYDISNVSAFWRRMAIENPEAVMKEGSHPTTAARYLSLEAARKEIEDKLERGIPLTPNFMSDGR